MLESHSKFHDLLACCNLCTVGDWKLSNPFLSARSDEFLPTTIKTMVCVRCTQWIRTKSYHAAVCYETLSRKHYRASVAVTPHDLFCRQKKLIN